jgi:thiamine pyrophosphate-dependent acetolactate synthase large subunit-like protein
VKSQNLNKDAIAKREAANRKAKADARERTRQLAAIGWDAVPISTARMTAELWPYIKDLDWSMIGSERQISSWPSRLWPMDKSYSHIGSSGGYGVGYNSPAAVGAALANRDRGRFSINFQPDGDMMYVPGVLWTAARHNIPMLTIMHNNRGYHQEVMHVQRMSNRRDRVANLGNDLGPIGTRIENPDIDYGKLAASMGWWSAGPITEPQDLGATFKRAVEVVRSGQPALVDVVTQPR